jgi:hypothetical protein
MFTARFKYDDFQFKIKAKSGDRGGIVTKLYVKTKRRWKHVQEAGDILSLIDKGKLT